MKLIISFLMMFAGVANAQVADDSIAQKCMSVAHQYAADHQGQPWSEDANFLNIRFNTCLVRVTQTCDQPPYKEYNLRYVIDMKTWNVLYFEADGCTDWP